MNNMCIFNVHYALIDLIALLSSPKYEDLVTI